MARKAMGVTWAMKLKYNRIIRYGWLCYGSISTHKFEIHEAELVIAVLFARVRVENISAGYAHDSGPIHALKKKLNTHVLYISSISEVAAKQQIISALRDW